MCIVLKTFKYKRFAKKSKFYFPNWWYVAPTIINTFLEQYDLTGKKVIPFATSGSSGMGNTNAELTESCKGAVLCDGRRFNTNVKATELKAWAEKF